ncbi:hypothetical protein AALO_G00030160 [Alosa alosa]|uniref:Reverse transcriptase domain-containing protein n=1 Tax=Alosa alosa TaxID=278164 RepID=A0AAV6HCD1_9TELE|nr:hypothetical protein AALO_G00030160 [Alosa alosa]
MLKHLVVLLALFHFSKTDDTIKEIIIHLRDLRDQQHLLTFVLESPYYPGIRIHWNVFHCKKVIAHELLRALDHVKIISSHNTHRLQETVNKLQINIEGLIAGDQFKSTIKAEEDCAKDKIMFVKINSMANSAFIDRYISAITPVEFFSAARSDRTEESGKSKGGGVCIMTNSKWCDPRNVTVLSKSCSPHLEHLAIVCRPFYLPREFTSVIFNAVYIPPQANTDAAVSELQEVLNRQQHTHLEAALIVAGDFNQVHLNRSMPEFIQHIHFPTRGDNTLDHCYTQFKNSYKEKSLPAFGKSDHAAVFLLPMYKQRSRTDPPVTKEVKRWTDQSEARLQDALSNVDWEMFKTNSADISEFTEVSLSYINMLTDSIIPTVKIRSFPNQKPWVDREVRTALKTRTMTYNAGLISGDMTDYKAASYSLRSAIKDAKRRYRDRVEADFLEGDPARVWKGLRTITGFERKSPPMMNVSKVLPDELNAFYARFDMKNTDYIGLAAACEANEDAPFCVSEVDVSNAFRKVNCRKATGPDGISNRVLKSCAAQLAPVFTYIFNTSLAQETVPTCFKQSVIVPVPKNKSPSCLNDYRLVALTSTVMKCFEKLVKNIICSSLPASFDPLQFAYRANRSTEDAISNLMHTTLTHLEEGNGNYVRMLFIDFSSAFNTIVPLTLVTKMKALGLNTTLCHWIFDFLTNRSQVVRVGGLTSDSLTISTGAPQGCVLSPLLYNIYTHDCKANSSHTSIIKFADDTVILGLISNNNEQFYLDQVDEVAQWCQSNSLTLNINKTKEMVVDYRRQQQNYSYTPLMISGQPVESHKF